MLLDRRIMARLEDFVSSAPSVGVATMAGAAAGGGGGVVAAPSSEHGAEESLVPLWKRFLNEVKDSEERSARGKRTQ
jgi:hypothetical protein